MAAQISWGIVGTGSIAHTFAKAVIESKTGTLTGVGSRSQESADKFGAEFGIPNCHPTYEALLADPEIQAVYISTPHPMHAEWAIKAAGAGKHVLCEKPMTLNTPDSSVVIEAARRNNVFLMEAFMYRCHPLTQRVVEIVKSGEIGQVRMIDAGFSYHASEDPNSRIIRRDLGGGGVLDVGCYPTSFAKLIAAVALGRETAEPLEVKAVGQLHPEAGTDLYTAAVLRFEGGILAQVSTGVTLNQDSGARIYGSLGNISVPSPWFCGPQLIIELNSGEKREESIEPEASLYAIEVDTFAEGVVTGRAPYPAMTAEDTLGNMRILDKWRAEVGVVFDDEKEDATRETLDRKPLRQSADSKMKFARVPGLDKPVSQLVMGTMLEGAAPRLPQGFALFDDYFARGGNCYDTAHAYGTEHIVGKWLQSRGIREELVIIGKGAHTPNCTVEGIASELEQTLDALGTDYVDIYLMHRDNLDIPAGEFVEALNGHLQAGRMRAFGGSNWSIARLEEANAYAREKGLTGFTAVSNNFSLARLVNPMWSGCVAASDEASKEWFTRTQTANFAWSSQARGFFVRGAREFTADTELVNSWYSDDNFERLARVQKLAAERGTSPINIALAYVLAQPFPNFALVGPRSIDEMRSTFQGLEVELSADEVKWLDLKN